MGGDVVRDELIELRGLRFHYRDWAARTAGACDLVLLHGYTSHARTWDSFAEAMTDRYRVLALDQRGHGESAWAGEGGYGVPPMVDDLAAFVSALGLKDFALAGLSMGGMVAMTYAARRPPELAALVIVDIGPVMESAGAARVQAGVRAEDVFESREAAFAAARAKNPVPPEAHHRRNVENGLMRLEDGRWTFRYDRILRRPSIGVRGLDPETGWRMCADIAAPTQIIRGADSDILSQAVAERMEETIPDAQLVVVPGAGHPVPADAPDGFLAAARKFLTG